MLTLLAEKAFVLRDLNLARTAYRNLTHQRSGLFISAEKFCVFKLARLLQDLARAKFAELRLLSFIAMIEEKLKMRSDDVVIIGRAPSLIPAKAGMRCS